MSAANYRAFIAQTLAGAVKPMRLHDATAAVEEWPAHVIPVGGLYLSTVVTDPGLAQASGGLGYGAWTRYGQGRCLVGLDETDTDWDAPNETRGAKTATPAGTVSAPTFTGTPFSSVINHTHPVTDPGHTHVQDAHTHPQNAHTHVQNSHQHTETAQGGTTASTTGTHLMTSAATGGSLRNAGQATTVATAVNQSTTAINQTTIAVNQSASTGVGTSAPVGGVASITPAGSVSAPTFTGSALSVVQPSIAVYVWRRVG